MEKLNKKSIAVIIASVFLLVASIIILLVFFVFNKDNSEAEYKVLRINADNVTLYVGQSLENYFTVSNEDAVITIDVDKDGIVNIDKEKIVALKSGKVNVKLTASYQDTISSDYFSITVLNRDYSFDIRGIENCYYKDSTLYITQNICQFAVDIYDKTGQMLKQPSIKYSCSDSIELQKQLGFYILKADKDGIIEFFEDEINYSFNLKVVCNF